MNSQTISAGFPAGISRALTLSLTTLIILCFAGAASAQRAITNASIEEPPFADGFFFFYSEDSVPGWLTSHPVVDDGCTDDGLPAFDCRPIERWSEGFMGFSAALGAGSRWVELNAYDNSMIYQNVCMTAGESFDYSFVHRGRDSDIVPDVAQFRIGIPIGLPLGSKPADPYDFPIVTVSTTSDGTVTAPPVGFGTINAPTSAGNGWVRYSGTYTYTGASQGVNLGFAAVSAAGGIASGNFIDDWQIALTPYIEFTTAASSGAEGNAGTNTPANGPAFRVTGTVVVPLTVNYSVTGGNGTVGTDYSLTVPFAPGDVTTTVSLIIPVGVYDGTSPGSIFAIPFSINGDTGAESNDTVTFGFATPAGATLASTVTCGGVPNSATTYTIITDDAPTAADVSIAGRVTAADGRAINRAALTLSGGNLSSPIRAMANAFGLYTFPEVEAGHTYVLSVGAKNHRFVNPVRVINLVDSAANVDFIAQP